MQNDQDKRPVLESAQELKGKKAGGVGGKSHKKAWSAIALVAVLAVAAGLYYFTDLFKPVEVAPAPTATPAATAQLLQSDLSDVRSVTITQKGAQPYTVLCSIPPVPEATPTPAPTLAPEPTPTPGEGQTAAPTLAPEPTPQPTPAPTASYAIEGQPYFEVKPAQVSGMADYASSLTGEALGAEGALNLGDYGLDAPALTAVFRYADGSSKALYLGDKTPTGSKYYARIEGDEKVYLLSTMVNTTLNKPLNELHTAELPLALTTDAVQNLLIEQAGKETIELELLQSASENQLSINMLRLVQPVNYDAHSTRGGEMLEGACAIDVSGYAGHASSAEELAGYGLVSPRIRIRITSTEGAVLDIRVGDKVGDSSYAAVDESGDVYLIDNGLLGFVSNARVSYLIDQFVNLVNIQSVAGLTVEGMGESYQLSIERETIEGEEGEEETAETYFFDEKETDESLFKKLYQSIIGTLADKVSEDMHLSGDVAVTVRYQLNDSAEPFAVEYLQYDDEYYAVRRDGLTLLLIKKDKVQSMMDDLQAYREGTFTGD